MATSKIPWTDVVWNPVTGCSKVSAGCDNCYARRMTKRLKGMGQAKYSAGFDTVVCHSDELDKPLRWKKPRQVFVNSMSDLFHKHVPTEFIVRCFSVMQEAAQHTFQVLTKRPERMAEYTSDSFLYQRIHEAIKHRVGYDAPARPAINRGDVPPPNVWLGTSVENQATANERIPHLLRCPAAVRFLSLEPLLGPWNAKESWDEEVMYCALCEHIELSGEVAEWDDDTPDDPDESWAICPKCGGTNSGGYESYTALDIVGLDDRPFPPVDWVIVGGESGPGARPMRPDWVRSIRDQCAAAGVPFFFKQHGEWLHESQVSSEHRLLPTLRVHHWPDGSKSYRITTKYVGNLLDGKCHHEWPKGA